MYVKLHKTLTKPILAYGSGCWALSKKDRNQMQMFERRILRMIYGPVNDSGVWRTGHSS
jgi:hypothetical protein